MPATPDEARQTTALFVKMSAAIEYAKATQAETFKDIVVIGYLFGIDVTALIGVLAGVGVIGKDGQSEIEQHIHDEGFTVQDMRSLAVQFVVQSIIEPLAAAQHQIWATWLAYQFDLCQPGENDSLIIPADLIAKWKTRSETPYDALPAEIKEGYRNIAKQVFHVFNIKTTNEETQEDGNR